MNRIQSRGSFGRNFVILSVSIAALGGLVGFTGDGSGLARAAVGLTAYHQDEGFFPRRRSVYESTGSTGYPTASVPIELVSLDLAGPPTSGDTVPLPPPLGMAQVDSFFDIFTELSIGSGGTQHVDSFFDITYRITGVTAGPMDGSWDVEILALEVKGQVDTPTGPMPVTIHESPTQASQGMHTITSLPGGRIQIDSFFDVFTELSLDGGTTWHPGNAPLHLDLTAVTPEPAAGALALLAMAGLGSMVRRRRR